MLMDMELGCMFHTSVCDQGKMFLCEAIRRVRLFLAVPQLCFVQDLSPHTTQTLQEGVLGCAWNHRAAWLGGDPQTGHVLAPIKITLKFRRYIYELAAFSLPLYARPTNGVPSLTEQHILVFSDRPRIHSQTSTDISVACLSLY